MELVEEIGCGDDRSMEMIDVDDRRSMEVLLLLLSLLACWQLHLSVYFQMELLGCRLFDGVHPC